MSSLRCVRIPSSREVANFIVFAVSLHGGSCDVVSWRAKIVKILVLCFLRNHFSMLILLLFSWLSSFVSTFCCRSWLFYFLIQCVGVRVCMPGILIRSTLFNGKETTKKPTIKCFSLCSRNAATTNIMVILYAISAKEHFVRNILGFGRTIGLLPWNYYYDYFVCVCVRGTYCWMWLTSHGNASHLNNHIHAKLWVAFFACESRALIYVGHD